MPCSKFCSLDRSHAKQNGLALVTVLFIFAVVSLLAMGMQIRQKMDIAQASATFSMSQAQLMAVSVEDFVKAALVFDYQRDKAANELWDTSSELWNQRIATKFGEAEVIVHIRDLQALFNLNSMAKENPDKVIAKERFTVLLQKYTQVDASAVAKNVMDWMDQESMTGYLYQSYEPPYTASGQPFAHPSELRLIDGMTDKAYDEIKNYITALPFDTPLNVNSTTDKILQVWQPNVAEDTYNKMLEESKSEGCGPEFRNKTVFKDVKEFWDQQELQDLVNPKKNGDDEKSAESEQTNKYWKEEDFSVNSSYFSALIEVKMEERTTILETIFKRDLANQDARANFVGIVYRDFSKVSTDISNYQLTPCGGDGTSGAAGTVGSGNSTSKGSSRS